MYKVKKGGKLLKVGNVFKTAEEAIETEQKIINEILKK